jgi:hypothetical protein
MPAPRPRRRPPGALLALLALGGSSGASYGVWLGALCGALFAAVPVRLVAQAPPARPVDADTTRGAERGALRGSVFSADGAVLAGAQVVVLPGNHRATSGADGRFLVRDVAPGPVIVTVRAVGYAPQTHTLRFDGSDDEVSVALDPAAPRLPTVVTRAQAPTGGRIPEFDERFRSRAYPPRTFVTRAQLEEQKPAALSLVFSRVPGLYMMGDGVPRLSRGAGSVVQKCDAMVTYVDGVLVPIGTFARGVDSFDWTQIEGIEIYPGGSRVPAQYNASNSACGVILLWTRVSR